MRIRLQDELLLIIIMTILLILIITFLPSNVLRVILGLPLVLFFPGYILMTALFPRRSALDSIERVALSFGLSIAVVPLIGLILNYTPWGISLYPILISLMTFIVVISIVAWYRRRRVPKVERFTISLTLNLAPWSGQSFVDKILSTILIAAILGSIGTLGYAIATPKVGERFTEFYVLGLEGKTTYYPEELTVGEEGRVILGIINREHEAVNYQVEVMINAVRENQTGPLELEHDERWEETVSFTPHRAGDSQKVEFLLYKNEEGEPHLKLHLWVDVKE